MRKTKGKTVLFLMLTLISFFCCYKISTLTVEVSSDVLAESSLPENIVDINIQIMNGLTPDATASMQRDIQAGKPSEVDGLVYEVVRMGEAHHVPVPTYTMIANMLRATLK